MMESCAGSMRLLAVFGISLGILILMVLLFATAALGKYLVTSGRG